MNYIYALIAVLVIAFLIWLVSLLYLYLHYEHDWWSKSDRIVCKVCGKYSDDLYLNTHNDEDVFMCGECLDEVMDNHEKSNDSA